MSFVHGLQGWSRAGGPWQFYSCQGWAALTELGHLAVPSSSWVTLKGLVVIHVVTTAVGG